MKQSKRLSIFVACAILLFLFQVIQLSKFISHDAEQNYWSEFVNNKYSNATSSSTPTITGTKSLDPVLSLQIESSSSSPFSFPPWIQQYISFHKSSIENGRLKSGSQYLIYQCNDGEKNKCGGAGDRLIGMIKLLYFAMCTNRVLLIDSPFPIPLNQVLNPSHIQWDADFPKTTLEIDSLLYKNPPKVNKNVLGYRVLRTNGKHRKQSLDDILKSKCMKRHLEKNGWVMDFPKLDPATAAHQAFWAMFQFDETVVSTAKQLKTHANIMDPYIGLHVRKGDLAMGATENQKFITTKPFERITSTASVLQCYHKVQSTFPNIFFAGAYLAADHYDTKSAMARTDPSIHYARKVHAFHIDKKTRDANSTDQIFLKKDIHQGVVETWAEILVLAESKCLVISKSMFAFSAYYIRGPEECNVYLPKCEDPGEVKNTSKIYHGENIWAGITSKFIMDLNEEKRK